MHFEDAWYRCRKVQNGVVYRYAGYGTTYPAILPSTVPLNLAFPRVQESGTRYVNPSPAFFRVCCCLSDDRFDRRVLIHSRYPSGNKTDKKDVSTWLHGTLRKERGYSDQGPITNTSATYGAANGGSQLGTYPLVKIKEGKRHSQDSRPHAVDRHPNLSLSLHFANSASSSRT